MNKTFEVGFYEPYVDPECYTDVFAVNALIPIDNFEFIRCFNEIAKDVHNNSVAKGFWETDTDESVAVKIALMHSELSEALEAIRRGNPPSEHIPEFSGMEEELADVIIRIMDLAVRKGYRVPEAILAKIDFNSGREFMHGGKRF